MAGDLLEMITEVLMAERLGEELEKDAPYKAAIAEEHHPSKRALYTKWE